MRVSKPYVHLDEDLADSYYFTNFTFPTSVLYLSLLCAYSNRVIIGFLLTLFVFIIQIIYTPRSNNINHIYPSLKLPFKRGILFLFFPVHESTLFNNYYCGMNEQVKKHRRNKAVEATQQCFRQSSPYTHLELGRKSIGLTYQSPKTFRSSDVANLNLRQSLAPKHTKNTNQPNPQSLSSNLRSTLQNLELKLKNAKKFLQNRESQKDLFGLQLSEVMQGPNGDKFWQKIEESTMNIESQRKLIGLIKSKQKIVWANKIKQYYLAQVAKGVIGFNQRALQHLEISLQALKSCKPQFLPDQHIIPRKKVFLPHSPQYTDRKTLVIDLDQTLFHCEFQRSSPDDIEVDISGDGSQQKGYVSIRPYALSFLKRAAQHFEIISFTASSRSYADTILDQIDFEHKLIQHRLYREHCVRLQDRVYAKDLSIINRPLSQMVLVDNSPISYLYQRDNGIPILPYTGGEDAQLLALQKYLDKIRKQSDVRVLNRKTFKLNRYWQFSECQQLVHSLYFQDKDYY